MALPPCDDGRADHRLQGRHGRDGGRVIPAQDARCRAVPRALARANRALMRSRETCGQRLELAWARSFRGSTLRSWTMPSRCCSIRTSGTITHVAERVAAAVSRELIDGAPLSRLQSPDRSCRTRRGSRAIPPRRFSAPARAVQPREFEHVRPASNERPSDSTPVSSAYLPADASKRR